MSVRYRGTLDRRFCRTAGLVTAAMATAGVLTACSGSSSGAKDTSKATQSAPSTRATAPLPSSAARGSSASSSAAGTNGEAGGTTTSCDITDAAEVAATFGAKVGSQQRTTSPIGNPTCTFTLTVTNIGTAGVVTVSINANESPNTFARVKASQGAAAQPVSGVGDDAFYLPAKTTLEFVRHMKVVVVQANVKAPGTTTQPKPDLLKSDCIALGKSIAVTL